MSEISFRYYEIYFSNHGIKYAIIWVLSDPYTPVEGHNWKFCPYLGIYGSEKNFVLTYFTHWTISSARNVFLINCNWGKVLKSRLSKFCGRQPLKKVKGYGLLIRWNFLKAVFHKLYLVHSGILCPSYKIYDVTIFAKCSIKDVWRGAKHVSVS